MQKKLETIVEISKIFLIPSVSFLFNSSEKLGSDIYLLRIFTILFSVFIFFLAIKLSKISALCLFNCSHFFINTEHKL